MIRTINHLCCALGFKQELLKRIVSNVDGYYGEMKQEKYLKNGKLKRNKDGTPRFRVINPSKGNLKILQGRINNLLVRNIAIAPFVFGATKGKDNVLNAKTHRGKMFFFQTDLQDFFPFVSNQAVYAMFIEYKFSPDVARVLTRLTTYQGHLPQGAATSATIANLVFTQRIGEKINCIALRNRWTFTTFVDDVTISSSIDFKDNIPTILKLITDGGFKISHAKTTYKTDHPNITGVKMGQNYLDVTDKFKDKLSHPEGKSVEQIRGEQNYYNKVKAANS